MIAPLQGKLHSESTPDTGEASRAYRVRIGYCVIYERQGGGGADKKPEKTLRSHVRFVDIFTCREFRKLRNAYGSSQKFTPGTGSLYQLHPFLSLLLQII